MTKTILIIEDDRNLQKYLSDLLIDNGFSVEVLDDGLHAVDVVEKTRPDLVILDLNLPTVKGESVCMELKKEFPEIPITVLTGKDSISDKVNAFEIGADDYITKPFSSEELLARIKARLRKISGAQTILEIEDLKVNLETMDVSRSKKPIKLTRQEFKLLECLLVNKGKVLSRETLLNKIWANSLDIETRVVDVYISYLRRKIDKGFKRKLIHSLRGFGYTIKD